MSLPTPADPHGILRDVRRLGPCRKILPVLWPHSRVAKEPDDRRRLLGRQRDGQIVALLGQAVAVQQELGVLNLCLIGTEPGHELLVLITMLRLDPSTPDSRALHVAS